MRVRRNDHGPRRPWGARLPPKASSTPARFRQKVRARHPPAPRSATERSRSALRRGCSCSVPELTIKGLGRIVDLFVGWAKAGGRAAALGPLLPSAGLAASPLSA